MAAPWQIDSPWKKEDKKLVERYNNWRPPKEVGEGLSGGQLLPCDRMAARVVFSMVPSHFVCECVR
ncbi:hypothetical protein J1614_011096 [Plenodomus biglobosus]|nr:hypothetical protein J1614_011096 [Plenodomus biglobosus]